MDKKQVIEFIKFQEELAKSYAYKLNLLENRRTIITDRL